MSFWATIGACGVAAVVFGGVARLFVACLQGWARVWAGLTVPRWAFPVMAAAMVGAVIGRSAEKKVWWSSLRQVLILIVACGVTYLIGSLFNVAVN